MLWRTSSPASEESAALFADFPHYVAQLLANRGIATREAADAFLQPDFTRDIHDPFLFREMRIACERVWKALATGEQIVVHGDYDADGVTGSTMLITTLRTLAARVGADPAKITSYIPHREKEGYGVRVATVEKLAAEGATLMITVDCGISCASEIARAKELGIDTIIVDHHQVPEKVPECITLHPWVPGETYPYRHLAAVGVAYKFACGLSRFAAEHDAALEPGFEKWLLDLVSIATVTDVVQLVGENRTLEKYGLIVLNKTRRIGLKKIIEAAGRTLGKLDTMDVGFYIGPRINAASRMDHAKAALDTLLAETDEEATAFAAILQDLNAERQRATERIMTEARRMLAADPPGRICVLCGEGWPAGLVGLVAGKIANEHGIPVFAFGKEGDKHVGSGRSIPQFNVVAAMDHAKAHILRYGGHPQACGLTIEGDENYAAFAAMVKEYAEKELGGVELGPTLTTEASLGAADITWDLVEWLKKFEPFGEGNPRPKFLLEGVRLSGVDLVGKDGKHARISVKGVGAKEIKMIGFHIAQKALVLVVGQAVDVAVEIGENEWNGQKRIEVRVVDVRAASELSPSPRVGLSPAQNVKITA